MTVKTIPGKEDSLERLESVGIEIPDKTEPFENVLINIIILEQALAQLTADERDIVNIALHISLKNFEQQCNGINIHVA